MEYFRRYHIPTTIMTQGVMIRQVCTSGRLEMTTELLLRIHMSAIIVVE